MLLTSEFILPYSQASLFWSQTAANGAYDVCVLAEKERVLHATVC